MDEWDENFNEWFKKFWGRPRFGFGPTMFGDIDEMRKEMEKIVGEQFKKLPKTPKELIREYETPEGAKIREVGPIVYGYSMTIGPDGKPKIRQFGNVKPYSMEGPKLTAEREPLADVITSEKEIKVVIEMPGVEKENVKVNSHDHIVEISADTPSRKYRKEVEVPADADMESVKSSYKNGILEVVFQKKTKPQGKQIKVD
ncbi:MAG TPA: archaeal heat shock protein Hsp20 [Candidatus Nitrosotalea sp.]|nr:archaeal heat shock protein Hsp20 [Candidatus Nitrosotalea sp.]